MEELIPIIILFVVSSIISSAKKNRQQKTADQQRHPARSAPIKTTATRSRPLSQPAPRMMPSASYDGVSPQVITPTVHPHVQPDCNTHDIAGSLGVTSMEGKDPCHEEQLTHPRTTEEFSSEQSGLTFDWTGDSMVKAIVMQEVLTRPANRPMMAQRRAK